MRSELTYSRNVSNESSLLLLLSVVGSLKDVKIHVPLAVKLGDIVTLQCTYDIGGASLYSVKWYKSRNEFFRYVAKEIPPIRVFPLPGVEVDVRNYFLFLVY